MAVFSGEAEFALTPATPIEKNYLVGLTGQNVVKESFDRALLCFTEQTGREIRSVAKTRADAGRLNEILKDYRKRLREESNYNVEANLLADLYRPRLAGRFRRLSAWPQACGAAVLREAAGRGAEPRPEEVMLVNVVPHAGEEIWYHAHTRSEIQANGGSSGEDHRSVSALSYKIETAIAKNDHLTASTTLGFEAVADGERVLALSLLPTLCVSRVTADGVEAPFIQEDRKADADFYIVLPKPLEKGSRHELTVDDVGDKVVRKEGGGNFAVGARESWYPNVNSFHDHAAYDLTFRVPKSYVLVSVGKLEKEWAEKDLACSHWVSAVPLAVAGFNYGTFQKKSTADPKLGAIEGYASPAPRKPSPP